MDKLLHNITLYLEFLKKNCGLSISIHFDEAHVQRLPHSAWAQLLPYNSHENPYCMFIKTVNHKKCRQSQRDVRKICKNGEAFCRTCYAGVYEYIYPVLNDADMIGFIAVSGYRRCYPPEKDFDERLWNEYLSDSELPTKLCNSAVPPLGLMLEKLFTEFVNDPCDEYNMILQFLNEFHSSITLSELCKHFGRSKSHISHMFKNRSGISLSEYCNDLKLKDARRLLTSTDIPVTQIALDVGFNDASYFIHLFNKKFGISPLKYRKREKAAPPQE